MDRAVPDAIAAEAEPNGIRESQLDRIAGLLGCPVETFANGDAVEASELLRLWLAIPDKDDRAKVLAVARKLAQS